MADWSQLVKGFQEGADFSQRFRANRQFEKGRDQALERGEYDLQSMRDFRRAQNPDAMGALGPDYAAGNTDWNGQLQDPFAFKLFDWVKTKLGKKKKAIGGTAASEGITPNEAISAQAPATPEAGGAESYALPDQEELPEGGAYADGGNVEDEKAKERAARNRTNRPGRVENATETVQGADRTATAPRRAIDVDGKAGEFLGRAKQGEGVLKRAGRAVGRTGALGALASTALDTANTPTEEYRKRFGLETNDPSLLGDIGVRALGAASDLGNAMTLGFAGRAFRDREDTGEAQAAPAPAAEPLMSGPVETAPATGGMSASATTSRRAALPTAKASPEIMDFSNMDIEPRDVPNMQLDDWKKYRAQMIAAAQKSGNPQAVHQVNDMVTDMQHKGFLNYGQQGLALQQAGNIRGAMAAYRAAFQYFPNGNDVEFGTNKDKRTGRQQIVGFGRDEKTGKVVPGTEMIMDPERVGVLLENFKNPQAFRMWTKDWRDYQQGQRKYEEVEKPLAQAQADYMATNADARVITAENAAARAAGGGGGAAGGANMRNAERVFRERLGMMGLQDEPQADYLASVMSQVKAANPQTPDNSIVQAIMSAHRDGSLQQRLQRMGIGGAPSAGPRQAIPTAGGGDIPPPPGVDPEAWNDPEVAGLPYDERVQVSTPAQ